jgi:prophage regulatory protein
MTITTILRLPQVKARTGLSRSTIYSRIAQGSFPKPVSLGGVRAVGWVEAQIESWIERQIRSSRGDAGVPGRGEERVSGP